MIGILVNEKLKANLVLMELINGNVFPLTIPDEVEVPHIAYGTRHFSPDYTKVGIDVGISVVDNIEISFEVSSPTYVLLQEIISLVRQTLEGETLSYNTITTRNVMLENIDENFNYQSRNYQGVMVFSVVSNRLE